MNFKLKRSDMVHEAARTGGQSVIVVILIFLLLFLIISTVCTVVGVPIMLGYVAAYGGFSNNMEQFEPALIHAMEASTMPLSLLQVVMTIVVCICYCKWIEKRKLRTMGFKKAHWLRQYGIGMLAGLAMMTLIVLIGALCGALKLGINRETQTLAGFGTLVLYFVFFLIQGMSEEVLCRGCLMVSLARKKGNQWMAILVSALVFAALHLMNPGIQVLAFLNLFLFGVFAGIYYLKQGNIWGIAALHSLWNFAQGNVWGVLVSGGSFGPSLFTSTVNPELELLNGGSFGLEGGLLCTLVLLGGILVLLKLPQKDTVPDPVPAEKQAA